MFETSQLLCHGAPNSDVVMLIVSCEPGSICAVPSPRNEPHDEVQCVDTYRYSQKVYPATCAEASDWFAGRRDCLVASHCSGSEAHVGDWSCQAGSCVCPPGGTCPVPGPPGGDPDAGSGTEPDAGVPPGPPG